MPYILTSFYMKNAKSKYRTSAPKRGVSSKGNNSCKKTRGKKCWQVKNKYTKKVFSKCSTEENAKRQMRLLRAIEFNKSFKLKPKGSRKTLRQRR